MSKAKVSEEEPGIRLIEGGAFSKREALVLLQKEHNQIVTVKSTFRKDRGRPAWDWLV